MRFRIRGPNGVDTVTLPDSATVSDLRAQVSTATSLPSFDLKHGYPPEPLDLDSFDNSMLLTDTGLKLNGQQLIASPTNMAAPLQHPLRADELPPGNRLPPTHNITQPATSAPAAPSRTARPQPSPDDPPEIPLPSHSATLLLRIMPDDNSCLFRAISYAVLPQLDSMHELRALVASHIVADPVLYNAAVLEKHPDAYCAWIQSESSWGGAIELGILAQHFGVEIASLNVQDGRVDTFNAGASQRCLLVYSGIHYDVVAASPTDRLGLGVRSEPEADVRVFDSNDDAVLSKAKELCGLLRQRHYYTDTAAFLVKCNICGWSGNGEKAATKHAMETGHMDFGESDS